MKSRSAQSAVAVLVCDEALAGRLGIDRFYAVASDLSEFGGFARMVLEDVLDFIEHQTDGQEWQRNEVLLDRLLLDQPVTDETRLAARAFLRRNLREGIEVGAQIRQYLAEKTP